MIDQEVCEVCAGDPRDGIGYHAVDCPRNPHAQLLQSVIASPTCDHGVPLDEACEDCFIALHFGRMTADELNTAILDWRTRNPLVRQPEAVIASQESDWDALIVDFIEWTMATFPHQTARSAMLHALKEQKELADKFEATGEIDFEEAVDCFMLYLASAHSGGVDFKAAFAAKLAKNKARQWGEPDADGVVEHVR